MNLESSLNGHQGEYDICLVSMPYVSLTLPSLALGLLKSILTSAGLKVKVIDANVLFTESIGVRKYHLLAQTLPTHLRAGEWSFSTSAFPHIERDDQTFLGTCTRLVEASSFDMRFRQIESSEQLRNDLLEIREEAELFIDELTQIVLATRAKIVGCTSTFEQHVPSLALLKKLKAEEPNIVTMMGGANCEAEMGLATHRNFHWVDYLVSGEADGIIVDLCNNAISMGTAIPLSLLPKGVLGPVHRKSKVPLTAPRIKFNQLDELPVPDYSDYFGLLENSSLAKYIRPGLPLETSRGCWWGALHHCTFCGLNGNGMGFRSKSPEKVLHEIETLEARHGISRFEVVDNILDMSFFNSLIPALTEDPTRRNLFYEVKANLSRDKILKLKEAGIDWIQPGIENLHTKVLDLMDKGVKGWQNIQLLKWSREFGVRLSWSVLFDFPGEKREWYTEMLEWIPFLEHLQAPAGVIPVRFDRFSVYHTKAAELGLNLLPFSALYHIYGLPREELNDLAYFFVNEGAFDPFGIAGPSRSSKADNPWYQELGQKMYKWRMNFWQAIPPILGMEEKGDALVIIDTRTCSKALRKVLKGLHKALMLACDSAPSASKLPKKLREKYNLEFSQNEFDEALAVLNDLGYILEIDGRYLSLAVRGDIPSLPKIDEFPGGNCINLKEAERVTGKKKPAKKPLRGLVAKDQVAVFKTPFLLDSGHQLPEVEIAYQTYGTLNGDRSNAILVFHTFTKNAHLAGRYHPDDQESGWWDVVVGPGKPLDTNKYFVVCSNVLGGSGGSTAPASINPMTGSPYAMTFPLITIGDMVEAQKLLMDHLHIQKWGGIIGGCFGGDQAMEWLVRYPDNVGSAVILSATPATSPHTIAISTAMRSLICSDANWNGGNYYDGEFPLSGLSNSILAAFPIWMSREAMQHKFGRRRIKEDKNRFTFQTDFQIEKAMHEMGKRAQKDFDANSLLYMSRAVEYFDLPYYYGSLEKAFEHVTCPVLCISYKSDWRYPPDEVGEIHQALINAGKTSDHLIVDHPFGHAAFVYAPDNIAPRIREFWQEFVPEKGVSMLGIV